MIEIRVEDFLADTSFRISTPVGEGVRTSRLEHDAYFMETRIGETVATVESRVIDGHLVGVGVNGVLSRPEDWGVTLPRSFELNQPIRLYTDKDAYLSVQEYEAREGHVRLVTFTTVEDAQYRCVWLSRVGLIEDEFQMPEVGKFSTVRLNR